MKRVATSLVLIPLAVWVVLAAPFWVFAAVLAVVGLLAFHEFDQIAKAQGLAPAGLPGMAAGMALLFAPEPFLVAAIAALVAMILSLLENSPAQRSSALCEPGVHEPASALTSAAVFLLGVIYIFGAWRCARDLREINPHWLMIALLVSWAGDTAALYVGRAFGKHKLAPRVSPAKTWEGFVGSVAGGMLAAGVYAHYLIPAEPLGAVLALAAAANIAGQMGDLCESAFKRGAGMKDSGTMLPGHGGWLDRIDSSLFSVPVVYATLVFILKYDHV
jgi:phosphatidate cytidylyltransferase